MDKKAKYCDDADCSEFSREEWGECGLGLDVRFRVPRGYEDIQHNDWGYVRPIECRKLMKMKFQQN